MKILDRDFDSPGFKEWFDARPQVIQQLIMNCPPGSFMINKETNQLMEVISWFEDGTVKAGIHQELNKHLVNGLTEDYAVFGIPPDSLEFYCWPDEDHKLQRWIGSRADVVSQLNAKYTRH